MNISALDKLWSAYKAGVTSSELNSLGSLLRVPGLGQRTRLGLTGLGGLGGLGGVQGSEAADIVARLLAQWSAMQSRDNKEADQNMEVKAKSEERRIFELGITFLQAAEMGQWKRIQELVDAGFPVNFQHPVFKETALHVAAACSAREVFNVLVGTGQCDYLLRDARGKLAWNNAEFFGHDEEISQILLQKTKEQAKKEDVDLLKEHAARLQQWFSEPWYNELSLDDDYTPAP